ncbi:WxL domain-containing protein [Enterococcus sp. LJL90]
MNGNFVADIQIVYAWNKGNKDPSLNAPDPVAGTGGRDYYWAPIYNANIQYSGASSSVTSVNSIDPDIAADFKLNYSTAAFNRILYEQVPHVEVTIDQVSDYQGGDVQNPNYLSGSQVSGTVNPNSFLAISLTRKGETTSTPLTTLQDSGQDDYLSGERFMYNAESNDDGDYALAIPDGMTLYVGDIITVRGFRWGKEDTQTYIVVDKTGPEATLKTYYTYVGEGITPTASDFVAEDENSGAKLITDKGVDDSTAETYPITFPDGFDISSYLDTATGEDGVEITINIADFATELEYDSNGKLVVDEAGNTTVLSTPNTSSITATLVVYDQQSGMTVDSPFDIEYSEISGMDSTGLSDHILNIPNLNLLAWTVSNGDRITWTDPTDFTVTDLGDLANQDNWAMGTDYPVVISPNSTTGITGVSATTHIFIINMNASLIIEFRSDGGTLLDTITVGQDNTYDIQADVFIGDDINLTEDDPYQLVKDKKVELIAAGYASVTLTTPAGELETAVPITVDGQTIVYTATGQLALLTRPTTINFGFREVTRGVEVEDPTWSDDDLVISDTRDTRSNWYLQAKLTQVMTSQVDTSKTLPEAIYYYRQDGTGRDESLTTEDQLIASGNIATGETTYNISSEWKGGDTSGFKLKVPAGIVRQLGDYQAEITWTLSDTP